MSVEPRSGDRVRHDNGVFYCLGYCFTNQSLYKLWEYDDSAPIRSSPAVAVLGGYGIDNIAQIAFGCDSGDVHVLLGTNGAHLGTFSCPGTNVVVRSTPAIADIDTIHNPMPEVIFGANNGFLYAVCFAGPNPTLVWSNNLSSPQPIFSSPAVADLDHSPDLEILVGTSGNKLYALRAIADPNLVPVTAFAGSPQSGGRPLAVTFTDQSSNSPISWLWNFGDGVTSTSQNPSHTYALPGTNSVTLIAGNAHGSATLTKTNYIVVYPVPVADFTGTPLFGGAPLTVQFTNQSLFGPTSWSWNFGDGQSSGQQHPSHIYATPGDYTVTLTAWNTYGTNVMVKTNYITVLAVCPIAAFIQDVAEGWEPLTVHFTDMSTNAPASWNWNFGDGTTISNQHPVHTYLTVGRYLVSLTVSNAGGSDTTVSSGYINVTPVVLSGLPSILEMHFDEGTGSVAHDVSTNRNDGTIVGAAWTTNGQLGSALYFHGGGQWTDGDGVVVPHSASLDITNTFWVEAWIKAQGTDKYLGIVDKFYCSGGPAYGFTLYLTDGLLRFGVFGGANGNSEVWAWLTDLRDNNWHHVVGGWDGSYLRSYVDGGKLGEVPWTNGPASTTQPLCIGKRSSGWGAYMPFLGTVDEVRISRAPLVSSTLSASLSNTNVVISWTGFGTLEAATNVIGPYLTVTNATCPYTVTPTVPEMFYRLSIP